jgi:dipeptidyl aminopeptidase/acylaminoacyl peptidase
MATAAPYGSWESPITIDLLTGGGTVALGSVDASERGIYWTESRPHEKGRTALVFRPHGGEPVDVVPPGFNTRSRVHEYGGGAYWRHGETVWCSNFEDGRVCRFDRPGGEPQPVTPEPPEPNALRYADGRVTPDGRLVVCVRERHDVEGEPVNELVAFPADGSAEPRTVASGRDFYSSPRISPDGRRLAWLCWDHPLLPFEGTELFVADLAEDGTLSNERRVAGSEHEAVTQPLWSPEGVLHFVNDPAGWWNLYAEEGGRVRALHETEAEFAPPQWIFGVSTYTFLPDGRIACVVTRRATDTLELLDPRTGELEPLDLPYTAYTGWSIAQYGGRILTIAASETEGSALITIDAATEDVEVVKHESERRIDPAYVSRPEAIAFPGHGGESYGFFYPPTNPDFAASEDELPPLIVLVHGGPTAHVYPARSFEIQYSTSRGIAVVDLNYGGSTGYGRAYRDRLRHNWGIVDVDDAAAAARYLAEAGRVDPERILITGGSAGGYTTLLAMGVSDVFSAGISEFGVADLVTFHDETHKFESRYDEYLIGEWPAKKDVYRERSPVTHADRISKPLLLLQGLDDRVVPPSQAEAIAAALDRNGVPYAYIGFEGEGHGFRGAEAIRRAYESSLSFMAQLFGFDPADEIEPIKIANLQASTGRRRMEAARALPGRPS